MEGCACQYSICQLLTAFSEISTHVLEIANLGVDLTTMHDSCDWDWTGATCWAIMCMQSLQCVTVPPPLRLRPHEAYKSLRIFPEGAPSCFLPWCKTTVENLFHKSLSLRTEN